MDKFGLIHPSDFRDYIKNALLYPHKHLEWFYKKYDENATSPLPADLLKRHNEMKELYRRIKASENDLEKWFSLLFEANDRKFVIHNIEYRINGDLLNKKLWKIYIKYLKEENDFHGLFHLYSKYCRFFLDDFEMKAEYETEVKKYGKEVSVAWTEPFEFESIESWDDVYDREKKANPNSAYISPIPTPMEPTGNFYENIIPQEFSLPKPLIRYILDCTNDILLRKLHQTCKYIFHIKPTPICYSIQGDTMATSFINEALLLNDIEHPPLNNYLLTNSLFAYINNPFFLSSTIIPSLSQCIAKYIKIGFQKLTFNELKFLIGSGNVESLDIFNSKITDEKNENVPLEDILKLVPKILYFLITETKCTPKTAEILSNINFQNKIKRLQLVHL
uniref:Uncharacterized protein n=1 Tax=Panagrolaimus davidi TaxID=227884 RepID=A0A914PLR8_9BILA